jgi:hypothetical protein
MFYVVCAKEGNIYFAYFVWRINSWLCWEYYLEIEILWAETGTLLAVDLPGTFN